MDRQRDTDTENRREKKKEMEMKILNASVRETRKHEQTQTVREMRERYLAETQARERY